MKRNCNYFFSFSSGFFFSRSFVMPDSGCVRR